MRYALVVTLALSLAANVFFLTRPTNDTSLDRRVPPEPPVQAEKPKPPADQPRIDISSLSPEVVAALREVDPTTLRDLLEACGARGPMLRAAVAGAIRQQHMAERHAIIMANRLPGWWQPHPEIHDLAGLRRLDRKIADEENELLRHHQLIREPWVEERYDFLSEAKKVALQTIENDYERMRMDVSQFYPRLPIETARAELLDEEYRKDLTALLSSDELAEFDFRNETQKHGSELRYYPLTDAEFRQAIGIIEARDLSLAEGGHYRPKIDPFAPFNPNDPAVKIRASAVEKIHALVGAEKSRIALRNKNHFFREMITLADRLEIPKASIEQIFDQVIERPDKNDPSSYSINIPLLRETIVRTLGPEVYHAIRYSDSLIAEHLKSESPE